MNRSLVPWVMLPENEAARQAVDRVRACLASERKRRAMSPLFLHGPSGTGKTRLVTDLADSFPSVVLNAGEMGTPRDDHPETNDARLVVVEDVQRLPVNATETLAGLIDRCKARNMQLVCTANAGPALLPRLPQRVASRLASGLVVGMEPLGVASRRHFLAQVLASRGQNAPRNVLDFLAATLPGTARALEGAATRLPHLKTLDEVKAAFTEDTTAPTVDRILARVGDYFHVDPVELCSARRSRGVLVPRQVSMYLARRLTDLSLMAIGERFGGRDHSTVLHACRKIEEDIERDANLSRAVRELTAGLS